MSTVNTVLIRSHDQIDFSNKSETIVDVTMLTQLSVGPHLFNLSISAKTKKIKSKSKNGGLL